MTDTHNTDTRTIADAQTTLAWLKVGKAKAELDRLNCGDASAPYQIRLRLLEMAKEIVSENGTIPGERPTDAVIRTAQELNYFVSGKTADWKKKRAGELPPGVRPEDLDELGRMRG